MTNEKEINIQAAINVIDKIVERIRSNSFSTKSENEMRMKVSDLREVINALGNAEQHAKKSESEDVRSGYVGTDNKLHEHKPSPSSEPSIKYCVPESCQYLSNPPKYRCINCSQFWFCKDSIPVCSSPTKQFSGYMTETPVVKRCDAQPSICKHVHTLACYPVVKNADVENGKPELVELDELVVNEIVEKSFLDGVSGVTNSICSKFGQRPLPSELDIIKVMDDMNFHSGRNSKQQLAQAIHKAMLEKEST